MMEPANGGHTREHHNRGLDRLDDLLTSASHPSLTQRVRHRLGASRQTRVRILEVGCGEGRLLLDLLARFSDGVELHGINAPSWPVISSLHDLAETNRRYGVMPGKMLSSARYPPRIHLADAQNLSAFKARQFDLVVSQMAIPHIGRKDRALEESDRLLARGGTFIHELDQLDAAILERADVDLPRFKILKRGLRQSTVDFLEQRGLTLLNGRRPGKPTSVVATYDKDAKALRLGLSFSRDESVVLKELPQRNGLWGVRSVYRA
ncbi:MAG: class I SAM-dependent methyltransferase [Vicinamibacteria bacterium]